MLTQQTQGMQRAQVVYIGIGRAVDGLVAEELVKPLAAHSEQFGEGLGIESRVGVSPLLLHTQFNHGHELAVVLQVGIALALDVALQNLARHLSAAAQFHVFLQLFRKVKVAPYEANQLILQPFHLSAQSSVFLLQLFQFAVHGHSQIMVNN